MLMGKFRHKMKDKVSLLVTLLCLCSVGSLSAIDKEITTLKVNLKDGTSIIYDLSKKPKITFTETDLIINYNGTEINYPLENMSL